MSRLPVIRLLLLGALALGLVFFRPNVGAARAEAVAPPDAGPGHSAGPIAGPDDNPYEDPSQCTYRAWELAKEAGHHMPRFGNAANWRWAASHARYQVIDSLDTRAGGSVAIWGPYVGGAGYYGHVGWVTAVDGNRFYVKERNWTYGDSERWVDWEPGISFILFPRGELQVVEPLTLSNPAPQAGEQVIARFKVKNVGDGALNLDDLVAAGRRGADASGGVADFPHTDGVTLQPGSEYVYQRWMTFADAGDYVAQPKAEVGGQWVGITGGDAVGFNVAEPQSPVQASAPANAGPSLWPNDSTRALLAHDKGLSLLLRLLGVSSGSQDH